MTSVPLYDTLGPDAVEYICNHAELAAVGCSAAVLPTLLSCLARCLTVKLLVGCAWQYSCTAALWQTTVSPCCALQQECKSEATGS
jgi:long-subunit acyl-CoA synthetase (AMP-forming)